MRPPHWVAKYRGRSKIAPAEFAQDVVAASAAGARRARRCRTRFFIV